MKVILTEDVAGLGHEGEVVEVARGYARNYLVPKSLAVKVTPGALEHAEVVRQVRAEAIRQEREEAQHLVESLAQALVDSKVVVAARAADEGRLFGSVGPRDIAAAIETFTGIEIDHRMIGIEAPIREIGLHEVSLRPHSEVELQITLEVIPA
ncbi:MAG: 50S ribosomal protein L9 [Acidimicrobiia bacterium]